jgi:methoxymalonate biosynthesis acyl carrier protein
MTELDAHLMDLRGIVRAFLSRMLRRKVGDSEDVFASGLVNSLFAMQLVLHVETRFGITVDGADLDLRNFRSVEAIAAFVARKTATGA